MKVSILFDIREEAKGGGNQFLKALRKEWRAKGIYTEDPLDADAVLFNSFPFRSERLFIKALLLKKKGKILVHRVDGPISGYRGKDLHVDEMIYQFNDMLADASIFQSEWSRQQNHKLGMSRKNQETVIMNTPDPSIFNKKGKRKKEGRIKLIAASWSDHWIKGFTAYKWLDENLDFKKYSMTFVGRSPVKFKNIKHVPPQQSKELAKLHKQHDIFITASKNDPCSNALIEAMHCGLPAIAMKDGGHPEIVDKGGELFTDKKQIPNLVKKIEKDYTRYQQNISLPTISEASKSYYEFIKGVESTSASTLRYIPFLVRVYYNKCAGFLQYQLKRHTNG